MADSAFKRGLAVGLLVGLAVVMVVPFSVDALGQTTITVEEINVYTEREQTQSVESEDIPVVVKEMSEYVLSRDAVYMGSLTFAGLAVFGSSISVYAYSINRRYTWQQKGGALVFTGGTLTLALFHISFAFTYGSGVFGPWMAIISVVLVGMIVAGAGWLFYTPKKQAEVTAKEPATEPEG